MNFEKFHTWKCQNYPKKKWGFKVTKIISLYWQPISRKIQVAENLTFLLQFSSLLTNSCWRSGFLDKICSLLWWDLLTLALVKIAPPGCWSAHKNCSHKTIVFKKSCFHMSAFLNEVDRVTEHKWLSENERILRETMWIAFN